MREAQNVRSAVYENQPYRTDESKQFISPRTRRTDIEILFIHEALCARRTRVTSAVERVDFSQSSALSFNKYYKIPTCKQIKSKTLKKGILCSENGLRSDPSKVDEYLQV